MIRQGLINSAAGLITDLIWPRSCLFCGRDDRLGEGEVCEVCWESLALSGGIAKPKGVDSLWTAFQYDDRLRVIIHRFKFRKGISLARPLAERMVSRLKDMGFSAEAGIVVPVPDHPSRRRDRGFNPAGLLAQHTARLWNIPFRPEYAVRVLAGPHQSLLPREQREKALVGSFNVAICDSPERTLILIDDVIHTGTTISRLATIARKAGWEKVVAVCLCG